MRTIRLDCPQVNMVFTSDWHLTDQPPGRRGPTYAEEVLGKIAFVGALAREADAVSLCGGDVFHQKSPRAAGNTHALVSRLIAALGGHPLGKVFGVHGNHDLFADRLDSLASQPLGVLLEAGVFDDLSISGSVVFENADGSVRAQVDAYPYLDDDIEALGRTLAAPPREPGVQHRVVLMHQYGNPGPQGSMHGRATIGYDQMADSDYDLALWGHDHSREGVRTVGNTTHVRFGSLARASIAGDEADRPVSAALVSFSGERVRIAEKRVPVKPLEAAFAAADKRVEEVRDSRPVAEFFAAMDRALGSIESSDPREAMRELCPPEEPALLALAYDLCGF